MKKDKIFEKIYGFDSLSIFLLLLSGMVQPIPFLCSKGILQYVSLIGVIPLILCIFRVLSKEHEKRWAENQMFLERFESVFSYDEEEKERKKQKKLYKYFDCPHCKLQIHVPKGKGRIEITCPKCRTKFIKKT